MLDELIAQIRAAPKDDAPRLVLADKLTEQGDPWGEIIALSCRLAAEPDEQLEAQLRRLREERWPLPQCVARLERGFFQTIYANDDALAQVRGPAFALLWILRVFNLTDAGVAALAGSELPGIVDLLLLERDEATAPLTASRIPPALAHARCRSLACIGLGLAPRDVESLVRAPGSHLKRFLLGDDDHPLTPAAIAAIAWPELEALKLHGRLSSRHVTALITCDALRGLAELDLSGNPIDDYGIRTLARTPWRRLATLKLRSTEITDAGIIALAGAPHLQGLVELAFSAGVHVEPYRALGRLAAFRELAELALSSQPLRESELAAIADLDLPRLRRLVLQSCAIDDAGARLLARSPALPVELELDLRGNAIADETATALRARFAEVRV